ncbi:MAG: type II toxin-antitoxin system HicA family toxin [Bacteroidetes bacterium]|nr:type II toxin-antitoxin system HicA family toxin [Bacteroidota bacterium]
MIKLPSSNKIIKGLIKHGFRLKSQKGSHLKYTTPEKTVIVPANKKEIPLGTLRSISRQSGIQYDEFSNQ